MKNQSGFTHWVVVILISIIAVGLVGAVWLYKTHNYNNTIKGLIIDANVNSKQSTETNLNKIFTSAPYYPEYETATAELNNQNTNINQNIMTSNSNLSTTNTINEETNINSVVNIDTNNNTNKTAEWRTYTNPIYFYSIQYPPDWNVSEHTGPTSASTYGTIAFFGPDKNLRTQIYSAPMEEGETMEDTFKRIDRRDIANLEKEQTTVAGIQAMFYKKIPTLPEFDATLIEKDRILYILWRNFASPEEYRAFLSTFTFTK